MPGSTRGRPPGLPHGRLTVRLPETRLHEIRAYAKGARCSEGETIRRALAAFFDDRSTAPPTTPQEDREAFYAAYQAVGHGRSFVDLHAIRRRLGWPLERFDRTLEDLRRAYVVELHGGDPSTITEAEIRDSYTDHHGTLYLTVSWRQ